MDPCRGTLELADPENGYGLTLDEIERFLESLERARLSHIASYGIG